LEAPEIQVVPEIQDLKVLKGLKECQGLKGVLDIMVHREVKELPVLKVI
jgi:hypothetical protein